MAELRIAGLVLAGGRSSRFGSPKADALLAGEPLIIHVARNLRPAVADLALSGETSRADAFDIVLADEAGLASGPLTGVLAGLEWAQAVGADWLVTAPCDAPLLPADMSRQLVEAATGQSAPLAFAATAEGVHPLCATWSPALAKKLRAALAGGRHPSVQAFGETVGAGAAQFEAAAEFLNINTPDDLARAEAILAQRR